MDMLQFLEKTKNMQKTGKERDFSLIADGTGLRTVPSGMKAEAHIHESGFDTRQFHQFGQ